MRYGLVGKLTALPGSRDELLELLLRAAELLEDNPDCIHYLVSVSDEADAVWVTETWTDRHAHDASLQDDEIRALIASAAPLVATISDQVEMTVLGGKGL